MLCLFAAMAAATGVGSAVEAPATLSRVGAVADTFVAPSAPTPSSITDNYIVINWEFNLSIPSFAKEFRVYMQTRCTGSFSFLETRKGSKPADLCGSRTVASQRSDPVILFAALNDWVLNIQPNTGYAFQVSAMCAGALARAVVGFHRFASDADRDRFRGDCNANAPAAVRPTAGAHRTGTSWGTAQRW